jgi:hypothetical protein
MNILSSSIRSMLSPYQPSFMRSAGALILLSYCFAWKSGASIKVLFSVGVKLAVKSVVMISHVALPIFLPKFIYKKADFSYTPQHFDLDTGKDQDYLGRLFSTFISQSIKSGLIVLSENLLAKSKLLDSFLFLPPMFGCAAMYLYRFAEGAIDRHEYKLKPQNIMVVLGLGAAIGFIGRPFKGTPLSKTPNALFELGGFFYDHDKFKYNGIIAVLKDPFFTGSFEWVVKGLSVVQDLRTQVEAYARYINVYYASQSDVVKSDVVKSMQCVEMPQQTISANTILLKVVCPGSMLNVCQFNFVRQVYLANYDIEKDITFSIVQTVERGYGLQLTQCNLPCVSHDDCEARLKLHHVQTNTTIKEVLLSDITSVCPTLIDSLTEEMHGICNTHIDPAL